MGNVTLDDIYKKHAFVYEIGDDYYYIGCGICRRCDSYAVINHYTLYKNILCIIGRDKIASESSNLERGMLSSLLYHFRKVMTCSDNIANNGEMLANRKNIDEMISSLSVEQRNEFHAQLKDFVHVYYYHARYI